MRRAMTKMALADAAGITARSISAYESGGHSPRSSIRASLSEVLDFPDSFWVGDDLEIPKGREAHFRASGRMSAKARDSALAVAALAIAVWQWAVEEFRCPDPDVPILSAADPETAADALRREWGLGEVPISNMIHLAEAHGVRMFSLPPDCERVDAFSFHLDHDPFVVLEMTKSAERRRFDVAHELGHLVLHAETDIEPRQKEREADRFASALLMPRANVRASVPMHASRRQLLNAKRVWGVSLAAMTHRTHSLGLLTDWEYRTHFVHMGRRGERKNEPEPMPSETSQLWGKVFHLLAEDGKTPSDVATVLGLTARDLRQMVFLPSIVEATGGKLGEPRGDGAPRTKPKLTVISGTG